MHSARVAPTVWMSVVGSQAWLSRRQRSSYFLPSTVMMRGDPSELQKLSTPTAVSRLVSCGKGLVSKGWPSGAGALGVCGASVYCISSTPQVCFSIIRVPLVLWFAPVMANGLAYISATLRSAREFTLATCSSTAQRVSAHETFGLY